MLIHSPWPRLVSALLPIAFACAPVARASSPAENGCHCDQYLALLPQVSLATNVAAIGTTAINSQGREFQARAETREAILLRIQAQAAVPAECRGYLADRLPRVPALTVSARGTFAAPKTIARGSSADATRLRGAYQGLRDAYTNTCGGPVAVNSARFGKCSPFLARIVYERFSRDLLNGKIGGKSKDVKILQAYHQIINAESEEAALALARSKRDGLSDEQFLQVVLMLGDEHSKATYDTARLKGEPSKGPVDGTKILNAMRNNSVYSYQGWWAGKGLRQSAGVCRDLAALQGKLLEARGFENTYVIGTQLDEDGHMTVATQMPGTRKLVVINYGDLSPREGMDGSLALILSSWERPLNYRVYKPGGRMVADVQSEMGKILQEASGGSVLAFDSLARTTSQIAAVEANVDRDGRARARMFHARDGAGAEYDGVAADARWDFRGLAPGSAGVVVAGNRRSGEVYGNDEGSTAVIGYARVEQRLQTPRIRLGDGTAIRVGVGAIYAKETHAVVDGHNKGMKDNQSVHRASASIEVDQRVPGTRIETHAAVSVAGRLGHSDNRDWTTKGDSVMITEAAASATATAPIGGDARLVAAAQVVVTGIGARGAFEAGIASRRVAATAHVKGALADSTSLALENSLRRAGVSVAIKPTDHTQVGLTGEVPLEGEDPLRRARVMGNFGVEFQ